VRLSNKIAGLDLAPFSENVENHWPRGLKRLFENGVSTFSPPF